MDLEKLVLFGVINAVGSILSAASGGGGALVSTPLAVALGMSPSMAIATAKFGGLGMVTGANLRFIREKLTDRRTVIVFSILGAIGAVLGSLLLVRLSGHEKFLEDVMGWVILVVGIPLLYIKKLGLEKVERGLTMKTFGGFLLMVGVVLQMAFSSGIGGLQHIVLMGCFGMTALTANATRRAMQFTVALVALAVFIPNNLIDYPLALVWFVTCFVGGYIGAHLAVKKGNQFIINLFALMSALLALQLIIN